MLPPNPTPRERRVSAYPYLGDHPEGVVVTCWVVPGASRSEIKGTYGATLRIRVAVPPEGGKANREVGRLLSAILGGEAQLLSGATSREKRILLRGIDRGRAEEALPG